MRFAPCIFRKIFFVVSDSEPCKHRVSQTIDSDVCQFGCKPNREISLERQNLHKIRRTRGKQVLARSSTRQLNPNKFFHFQYKQPLDCNLTAIRTTAIILYQSLIEWKQIEVGNPFRVSRRS